MMANLATDLEAFRTFEYAGWLQVGSGYHEGFAQLTTQAVKPLLAAVRAREGIRMLDVATGPGYVAAAAADECGAQVIGLDFSTTMVALARELFPKVDFRLGDAEALPFPAASFDAVVMNFGLLHLACPEQALVEMHRVLRSGGRLGFTVWANPKETVAFGLILDAVQTHGTMAVPLPPGPPLFRFSDAAECHAALRTAGFTSPTVEQVPQVWRLPSAEALLDALERGTVRNAALLHAQTPTALAAIRAALRDGMAEYEKDGMLEIPMPAVLASATKS